MEQVVRSQGTRTYQIFQRFQGNTQHSPDLHFPFLTSNFLLTSINIQGDRNFVSPSLLENSQSREIEAPVASESGFYQTRVPPSRKPPRNFATENGTWRSPSGDDARTTCSSAVGAGVLAKCHEHPDWQGSVALNREDCF